MLKEYYSINRDFTYKVHEDAVTNNKIVKLMEMRSLKEVVADILMESKVCIKYLYRI